MKKLLFTFLLISGTAFNSMAQAPKAVKISPFTFLKGQAFMVHYEHNLFNSFTVSLGAAPVLWGPLLGSLAYPPNDFNMGVAIDPEVRWYAKSDQVMNGFFVGLYNSNRFSSWYAETGVNDVDWSNGEVIAAGGYDVTNRKIIVGLQLGTQKLIGDHFCVDFYGGVGVSGNVTTATERISGYVDEVTGAGINFRCNIALGWQF